MFIRHSELSKLLLSLLFFLVSFKLFRSVNTLFLVNVVVFTFIFFRTSLFSEIFGDLLLKLLFWDNR